MEFIAIKEGNDGSIIIFPLKNNRRKKLIRCVLKEIKNYLSTSKKIASKIYQAFILYGGATQWDLCNAITDVAHDVDIETRLTFEAKAMSVPALKQVA